MGMPRASAPTRPASGPDENPKLDGKALWVVFLVAATLRIAYLLSIRHAYFFEHLQTEPLRYQQWATLILEAKPPRPPFDEAPGYAYFVAAVFQLCRRSLFAMAIVQAILDATTCAAIALLGRRFFGARVGWIAGLLAAGYGPFLYFTGQLEPATVALFLIVLALAATLASTARPRWMLAGGVWALALLVRPEVLLALPFAALDAARRGGRQGVVRLGLPVVVVLAASVAVNAAASHKLVFLSTTAGLNLWVGNNPDADGVSPFLHGRLEADFDRVVAGTPDPVDADAVFRGRALAFLATEPGAAARLAWKKLVWTFSDRELPNSADIGWQTSQSALFHPPLFPLSLGWVLPFAVAGALLLGREWRRLPLLCAPLAVGVGTSVLFFTNARFRLAMLPSLLLLAAFGLDGMLQAVALGRRAWRPLAAGAFGILLGLVAAWNDFAGVRSYRVPEISVNTGMLERESGDLQAALRDLRQGLEADAGDTLAWRELALTFDALGDAQDSLRAALDGLSQVPGDPTLRRMAATRLSRRGSDLDRLDAYLRAETPEARAAIEAELLARPPSS